MFTVRQLSRLAGVTPRTLHHYDAIGLLKPSSIGENGYRYYDEGALIRLQQILFYRELDLRLEDIKEIVGRRNFDVTGALLSHRVALKDKVSRLNRLIQTVDKTLEYLKGEKPMSNRDLFNGFSEAEQEKYALEAEQIYDVETVRASNRKWKNYSAAEKGRIMTEGKAIYMGLIAAISLGPADPKIQALIARWHRNIERYWSPKNDQLIALANSYNDDPRFKFTFDKMDPHLAKFMGDAVMIYVNNRGKRA
jgi:MerR family transcriptional regulator, thiopeptide resistance regulator